MSAEDIYLDWWREVGSGIIPFKGEDTSEFVQRVSREAVIYVTDKMNE